MGLFYRNQPFIFGEATYHHGGVFGPVPAASVNLVIVLAGGMGVRWDGSEVEVPAGSASLIYSRQSAEFTFHPGVKTRVQWCETGEPAGSPWVRQQLERAPRHLKATAPLRQLMNLGLALGLEEREQVCAYRDSIGEALFCAYLHESNLDRDERIVPEPVVRGRKFIETHFGEAIGNAEIARRAGVSPQNLARLFKDTLGVSPTQHIWNLRAERGAFLLRQTDLTVSEIAYQCGYKNPFHFSRQLKAKFGHSPSELRRLKQPLQPSLQRGRVPDVHFNS